VGTEVSIYLPIARASQVAGVTTTRARTHETA
jgi:hypothetical protein